MSRLRIYAVQSGRCLTDDCLPKSDEVTRIQNDFYSGVRFIVDSDRSEVRGYIPAHRTTEEVFFGVLDMGDNLENPLEIFSDEVISEFEDHNNWSIRYDTPEGEILQLFSDPQLVSENHETSLISQIKSGCSNGSSIIVSVPTLLTAAELICNVSNELAECSDDICITTSNSPNTVNYDQLYLLDERISDPSIGEPTLNSQSSTEINGSNTLRMGTHSQNIRIILILLVGILAVVGALFLWVPVQWIQTGIVFFIVILITYILIQSIVSE